MTPKTPSSSATGALKPRALVPLAHVMDVQRAIAFYRQLGFTVGGSLNGVNGTIDWAVLEHDGAQIMFARATAPVLAEEQAVLFCVYYQDIAAAHAELTAAGLDVGPMLFPPHAPRGEFRMIDPDGYVVQITHT